ncbi:hypothetical protein [Deinococcus maricopensis]|uniref:Bacterial Ig-like domain-containing protein n=1 Tax=Deinococcus maricopensis (strain DSM 21211 / LMG 22137 / NRRL B-23946 / LB-34) TaxID=709986 RepID=E8U396_DEIML|nr:hypothetical protein [Deinococcus maricopensis]ADV66041.1 hypothetical protein Deima_0381 [Deinococcus maricopensis DSM 21211]
MRQPSPLILATLALALGACMQTPAATPAPAPSGELVTLTLNAPFGPIKTQGLPGGAGTVNTLKVVVHDASGHAVTFDGQNVYQADGPQAYLQLDVTSPNLKVVLPKGTYTFENIGKNSTSGAFLAYGTNADVSLTDLTTNVNLSVHTLLDPAHLALSPRMPVSFTSTTDVLDLRLRVPTPLSGNVAYDVPLSDYDVTYDAPLTTTLGASPLGTRLKVIGSTDATAINATATVQAWVADGPEHAARQTRTVTATFPLKVDTISADLGVPDVTLDELPVAVQNLPLQVSGTANDPESRVAAVQVYDGTTLIGSTNPEDDVAAITFGEDGTGATSTAWTMTWTPDSDGAHDLTVIATDPHGNESRAQRNVDVLAYIPGV